MAKHIRFQKQESASCKECSHWPEVRERVRIGAAVEKAIKAFENKIEEGEFKPTVGEYVKLMQLENEIEERDSAGKPRRVTVEWIDSAETSDDE